VARKKKMCKNTKRIPQRRTRKICMLQIHKLWELGQCYRARAGLLLVDQVNSKRDMIWITWNKELRNKCLNTGNEFCYLYLCTYV
jgi:hypothetical protein